MKYQLVLYVLHNVKTNVSENDKDKANKANIPSKVKPERIIVSRQSLESLGKTMRISTPNLT